MEKRFIIFFLVMMFCFVSTGIVKRDTLEDIGGSIVNSVKDLVGIEKDKDFIEDLKIDTEKYCVQDSQCFQFLQHCQMTHQLYGTCTFYTWFWVALASAFAFLFCSCLTSILCCCCGCCRKAT